MAEETDRSGAAPLDEWVTEAGEEDVVASIRAAKPAIEDWSTPGFTDREALLEYLGRRSAE